QERRKHRDHRIIDPDIDRAEFTLDRVRGCVDRVSIGNVDRKRERCSSGVSNFPPCRVEPFARPRDQADGTTASRELDCCGATNPGARASYDDDLWFGHTSSICWARTRPMTFTYRAESWRLTRSSHSHHIPSRSDV